MKTKAVQPQERPKRQSSKQCSSEPKPLTPQARLGKLYRSVVQLAHELGQEKLDQLVKNRGNLDEELCGTLLAINALVYESLRVSPKTYRYPKPNGA